MKLLRIAKIRQMNITESGVFWIWLLKGPLIEDIYQFSLSQTKNLIKKKLV